MFQELSFSNEKGFDSTGPNFGFEPSDPSTDERNFDVPEGIKGFDEFQDETPPAQNAGHPPIRLEICVGNFLLFDKASGKYLRDQAIETTVAQVRNLVTDIVDRIIKTTEVKPAPEVKPEAKPLAPEVKPEVMSSVSDCKSDK
jgi:hypothetical protein